jgi:hypothetical protein
MITSERRLVVGVDEVSISGYFPPPAGTGFVWRSFCRCELQGSRWSWQGRLAGAVRAWILGKQEGTDGKTDLRRVYAQPDGPGVQQVNRSDSA